MVMDTKCPGNPPALLHIPSGSLKAAKDRILHKDGLYTALESISVNTLRPEQTRLLGIQDSQVHSVKIEWKWIIISNKI